MKKLTVFLAWILLLAFALPLFSCRKGADGNGFNDPSDPEEQQPSVMPQIHITTGDGKNTWATKYTRADKLAGRIDYVDAVVNVTETDGEHTVTDAAAEVKVRGNYTLDYAKKPIRIKFKEKTQMLGLHDGEAYKNWVLLADWKDPSMLRNALTFYLGNAILGEDGYYCSDFKNVEVYLNGEYWGVYLLAEQQEVKDGRTSVPEVDKGYTGTDIGYFFEYDGYSELEAGMPDGDPTFEMKYGDGRDGLRGYTVKSDIYSDAQVEFLRSYMDDLYTLVERAIREDRYYGFNADHTALVEDGSIDCAMDAVDAVIDLDSLVDTYILNEIACDLDVDFSSFYLSLDMSAGGDGRLVFEAPWDFDSAYGIWVGMCTDAEGMYAMEKGNPWFDLLDGVAWFEELVRERWAELYEQGVFDGALSMIETQTEVYRSCYIKNNRRWQARLEDGHGSLVPLLDKFPDPVTAQATAADHLYGWLEHRIAYLDGVWSEE